MPIDVGSVLAGGAKGAAAGTILGPFGSLAGGAIGVALELAPQLSRWVFGADSEATAKQVVEVVRTATGTSDPAAQAAAVANPAVAADLRVRLAQIAAERERAKDQALLEEVKVAVSDRDSARKQTQTLAASGSSLAWGAAAISIFVLAVFTATMVLVLTFPIPADSIQIVIGLVEILKAMAIAVVSYWVGSSAGSARKDDRQTQLLVAAATPPAPVVVAAPAPAQPAQPDVLTSELPPVPAPVPTASFKPDAMQGHIVLTPPPPRTVPVSNPAPTPTRRFLALHAFVQAQEGDWADHPKDPGGATMKGITLATFRAWRENPDATKDELRAITDEEVRDICFANYWNVCRCDALPPGVDLSIYDMAVNAGPKRSVMLLQQVLGVEQDGVVGPITLAAVQGKPAAEIIEGLFEAQRAFYRSLPGFATFGTGWLKRVVDRRVVALQMPVAA